jgi:hypothetical protein
MTAGGISFFINWKLQGDKVHSFYFGTDLLRIESTQVLDVPDAWDALTVGPLEVVGR